MKTELLSFILRAKSRFRVLKSFLEGEKVLSQISNELGMYKSHVSRAIKELETKKLIRCVNPKDRRYRFYAITPLGKEAYKQASVILEGIKKGKS